HPPDLPRHSSAEVLRRRGAHRLRGGPGAGQAEGQAGAARPGRETVLRQPRAPAPARRPFLQPAGGAMSRSDARATHSGFARFPPDAARAKSARLVLDADPGLKPRAFLSETQPTIVFERLTAPDRDRIRSALDGLGRWFDDVQFQPMSSAGRAPWRASGA